MKKIIGALLGATLLAAALPAAAQFAKPEIWKQSPKFKEASDKFQQEAVKLAAAAKTGKEDAFKAAFTATAATCKGCHDDFRNK